MTTVDDEGVHSARRAAVQLRGGLFGEVRRGVGAGGRQLHWGETAAFESFRKKDAQIPDEELDKPSRAAWRPNASIARGVRECGCAAGFSGSAGVAWVLARGSCAAATWPPTNHSAIKISAARVALGGVRSARRGSSAVARRAFRGGAAWRGWCAAVAPRRRGRGDHSAIKMISGAARTTVDDEECVARGARQCRCAAGFSGRCDVALVLARGSCAGATGPRRSFRNQAVQPRGVSSNPWWLISSVT